MAIAEEGRADAIVVLGSIDAGYFAMRMRSKVPVAMSFHSALHVAAMIGDRISVVEVTDPLAVRDRRLARQYRLDDRLVSVRALGRSSTELSQLVRGTREERLARPELHEVIDLIVDRARRAVEDDLADTLILTFSPFQCLAETVHRRLEEAGLGEIPVVWPLSAAIAMARSMAALRLLPSRRAFPDDLLSLKPAWR